MSETELTAYLTEVDKWTDETYPQLAALADSWVKVPVKDFDEGLRLCSALMKARPFLKEAYRYEARRAINILNLYLQEVRKKSGLAKLSTRPANDTRHFRAVVEEAGTPDENGTVQRRTYEPQEVDGRRPEQLAQYLYMLPECLRTATRTFPELYLELAELRGRLEVLVEHPHATNEQRAAFADAAVRKEQQIREVWTAVDEAVAYYQQNGHPVEEAVKEDGTPAPTEKRAGEYTYEEIEAMPEGQRNYYRKARIELDKKYLRRKDMKQTDEYLSQVRLRVSELLRWGETLTPKAKELCERLGIDWADMEAKGGVLQ
jgi:hypothetical protein